VSEHALPKAAKSAERIEGAMIAGGDIMIAQVSIDVYNMEQIEYLIIILERSSYFYGRNSK